MKEDRCICEDDSTVWVERANVQPRYLFNYENRSWFVGGDNFAARSEFSDVEDVVHEGPQHLADIAIQDVPHSVSHSSAPQEKKSSKKATKRKNEPEATYEVDHILDSRIVHGSTVSDPQICYCVVFNIFNQQYLVRWKGWDPSFDSWEPEEHLHCPELMAKYHRSLPPDKRVSQLFDFVKHLNLNYTHRNAKKQNQQLQELTMSVNGLENWKETASSCPLYWHKIDCTKES